MTENGRKGKNPIYFRVKVELAALVDRDAQK